MSAAALRLVGIDQKPSLADELRKWADGFRMISEACSGIAKHFDAPASAPAQPEERWLTPEEAARIVCRRMSTEHERRVAATRICIWSRGKRWASRPNQRTVLIEEFGFRDWLNSRRDRK